MTNRDNLRLMRERIEALPHQELVNLTMGVLSTLYPGGDMEHEWDAETLDHVAIEFIARHIVTVSDV